MTEQHEGVMSEKPVIWLHLCDCKDEEEGPRIEVCGCGETDLGMIAMIAGQDEVIECFNCGATRNLVTGEITASWIRPDYGPAGEEKGN